MEGYWKDGDVTYSLAELSQSVFATLKIPGTINSLGLSNSPSQRECLILIDGFGMNALSEFGDRYPGICELIQSEPLRATFPSTTATSLTSLGTGLHPGAHGMVGYTMRVPNSGTPERTLNALKWDERVDPVIWQPHPTLFERATAAGISVTHVANKRYADTGFTRAALRGSRYQGANSISEMVAGACQALAKPNSFAYLYLNDVDEASHAAGFGSERFLAALTKVDELIRELLGNLPSGVRIWLTSDHGMINRGEFVIVGQGNDLLRDVRLMAGEPRVRYLYIDEANRVDVKARWQDFLGDRALVLDQSEAITEGLFGPEVSDVARERIGDLIVIANDDLILVEEGRAAQQCAMVGHHGGVTQAEIDIPLLSTQL